MTKQASMTLLPAGNKNRMLILFLFVCCLCIISIHIYRKPNYNWDMLAYMAIVIKKDQSNIDSIHQATYKSAKEHIPAKTYHDLTHFNPYMRKMAGSATDFYTQLPFYVVKPLYTEMIHGFYKMGFPLPVSTRLPSILSYLLTGLLLLYWLMKYLQPVVAGIAGIMMMYCNFMIDAAKMSSPDCLSGLLLLAAFYCIIERPSILWMCIFFVLAMLARLDNVITCGIMLSFLFFTRKWHRRITLQQYVLAMLLLVACYFSITILTLRSFSGWNTFYYPTFGRYLTISHDFQHTFSWRPFLHLMYSRAITGVADQLIGLFAFLAFMVVYTPSRRIRDLGFDQLFVLVLFLIIFARFLLFPDLSNRFYLAFYLCILVLLIKKYLRPAAG